MQNEELRHSKDELEALKNRYFDLYDLAPVGCSMPVMNGYEATAIIRDQKSKVRNHAIPIIALTANAQRVYRDKCLAVGMNDYLSKPVLIPELFSKIEKWSAIEPTPSVALLN